jgi:orotidine-5'-phosphate decarboxylase
MAKLAQQSGLSGIVCSPQEAKNLRSVCGQDFLLVCPGVRPVGSDQGDQQRTMPPKDAIEAGASYLVIGRPITAANDPATAFEKIVNDLS